MAAVLAQTAQSVQPKATEQEEHKECLRWPVVYPQYRGPRLTAATAEQEEINMLLLRSDLLVLKQLMWISVAPTVTHLGTLRIFIMVH